MLHKLLHALGNYLLLMRRTFSRPQQGRVFRQQFIHEFYSLGYNSLFIVILMSLFIGALLCVQIKLNVWSPWMPRFTIGYAMREVILLEFASSIICIILAGKVGSNIASEIGTMRVTQQIDALEIMGVNSANFLILPKIAGLVTMIPILVIFSMAAGIVGAYAMAEFSGFMTPEDLTVGLQYEFDQSYIGYSIIKSIAFSFIITSVSSFYGYTVTGGSIEVGKASTNSVVSCSALILFFDIVLTQILM